MRKSKNNLTNPLFAPFPSGGRYSMGFPLLISFVLFFMFSPVTAQTGQSNLLFQGYLTNMQSVMFQHTDDSWIIDNLLHNRLQLKWYANDHITTDIEVRNRFSYGKSMEMPGYKDIYTRDQGWVDLSFTLASGTSYILESTIDRAWANFRFGNWEFRAGRQRINWGKTMVWNPNDIFNAYSFFDFDYPEKPGCDALRIQYYTGAFSNLEASVKVNGDKEITAAGMLRINPGMYDLQFFGGVLNSQDLVAGTGWSGNIKNAGFSGEVTLFQPKDSSLGKGGDIMYSVSTDYTFRNSLFVQLEFLYSSVNYNYLNFTEFYFLPLTVKEITFTDFNIFGQVSYPFTPLFSGTFSGIYYPSIQGFFMGPSLSYNIQDNLDISFFMQYFNGEFNKVTGRQKLTLAFLRLKWSF
ncbi:MAG: hypothetical protein J7K46_09285 [Bacteroidales bacterium]|nr:hypothetical protein [Bacteroidales bacterium]